MLETPSENQKQMLRAANEIAASRALFARVTRRSDSVILPLNPSAADPEAQGPALFCIHSIVGAGVTDFLALARRLAGSVRVFGVQAPPQRMKEPSFGASVTALADSYASAVAAAHPGGPIVVAGWSAGAAIALAVAHALRARGREVALVVAIDGAPEIPSADLHPWDPRYWIVMGGNLPKWFAACRATEKGFPASAFRRWSRSHLTRLQQVLARRTTEVAPKLERSVSLDRFPPEQRQFMARLYDAIMCYVPDPWDGPVVLYEARALNPTQYLQRWRSVAPQAELAPLDATHVTILHEPQVAKLARDLHRRIAEAVTAPGEPDHAAGS